MPIRSVVYQPAGKQNFVAKMSPPPFFLKFGQVMITSLAVYHL